MKFWNFFIIMSCLSTLSIHKDNITNTEQTSLENIKCNYPILEKCWKTQTKNKLKFVMTNFRGQKITEGFLEWDFSKNEWNFYYDKIKITIKNNQIISQKQNSNVKKINQCSGFAKILSKPIEKWEEVMPFDNEIEMKDNTCYTEFKNNKSYLIIYFQIKEFKLISITFSENGENYIFSFYPC